MATAFGIIAPDAFSIILLVIESFVNTSIAVCIIGQSDTINSLSGESTDSSES